MLKFRTTLTLLLACGACGALLWFLNRPAVRAAAAPRGREDRLFGVSLRDVDYLLVEREHVRVALQRGAADWSIVQPFVARADPLAVQRLLDRLERAPRRDTLPASELALRELRPDDFGLAVPLGRIVLSDPLRRAELLIGRQTPLRDGAYVCFAPSEDVQVTEAELLEALPESVNALRDRALHRADPRRITALALRRPGAAFVKLTRDEAGWQLVQPVAVPADGDAVKEMLDALATAQIARFVWPSAGTNAAPAGGSRRDEWLGFGFDGEEDGVQVQLWEGGDPVARRYRFGAPVADLPDHIHALTADGQAVVAVTGSVLRALTVPLDVLREKRLFAAASGDVQALDLHGYGQTLSLRRAAGKRWELTAPVVERADQARVAQVLDALLRLRATAFDDSAGAAAAVASNVALRVELTTDRNAWHLLLGAFGSDDTRVRLCFTNAPTVYWVPVTNLPALLNLRTDAAALRDRTVLAVAPDDLRHLSVRRAGGVVEAVTREADGGWHATDPVEALDRLALDAWLELLGHLEAQRVVSLQGVAAANYGLEPPFIEVTLDLNSDDALRRVLRVGGETPDGGRYAAIKGHDAVFVLPPEVLRILQQPLVRIPSPELPPGAPPPP